jgi:hypothetical protein
MRHLLLAEIDGRLVANAAHGIQRGWLHRVSVR